MTQPRESVGTWHEPAPRVWTAVAEPDAVNVVVVAGERGALVVDPGSSPEQGRALRAAAEELAGRPVLAAVATHAHTDHAGGLPAFADLTTYGHEGLPGLSHPFALAAGLDLGGRWVEMAHLGEGHTGSDVVVVVADADLVLVGDLLESAGPPWWGPDSCPDAWPGTLDSVLGLLASGRVGALPGHGPVMTFEQCLRQRGEVAAVAAEVERLLVAGVDVEQAAGQGRWPYPVEHVADGVRAGYARLAARGVRPRRDLPVVG